METKSGFARRTVLVLDDNEEVASLILRLCERLGLLGYAATSVASFYDQLPLLNPTDIVLDLQLGQHDGIEVLRYLANAGSKARITLLSGTDSRMLQSARELALGLGLNVSEALSKPIRAADFIRALGYGEKLAVVPAAVDIERGIDNDEFYAVYQPIVTCSTDAVSGLEALMRWKSRLHGELSPSVFIPMAEADTTLMDRMTFSLIRSVSQDVPKLQAAGFRGQVSLNISTQNLRQLDFPDRLIDALSLANLRPQDFKLEITETAAMTDPQTQFDVLLRLSLKGFALSIDDFGTGYSSISMLKKLPYSELKIDRSFVSAMTESQEDHAIVRAALALASSMGLTTVGEGVENEKIRTALKDLGATAVQGYGIARPMAVAQMVQWISERPDDQSRRS